ncbi:MAG: hypothetical protein IT353_11270 [Gemmatimonadaceae bacterium]|nr:hypothetical protein [Gemmatimonadaceae bacterium]
MHVPAEFASELAAFPAALRVLVEAELAEGNTIAAVAHGFPAAPCGASILLERATVASRRASTSEVVYYARNGAQYAGEFTTAERHFFVLEPPGPPAAEPDMDAIRAARQPRHDPPRGGVEHTRSVTDHRQPLSNQQPTGSMNEAPMLESVAAVQHAIVEGVMRGGRLGLSHKEGGTNIVWRGDRFIRSDYGEFPHETEFRDVREFLTMLWTIYHVDLARTVGGGPRTELEVWTQILHRVHAP